MEFMLIFAIVLILSVVFLRTLNTSLSDLQDKQDFVLMQNLANMIRNEIVLTSQVSDNYIRRFEIPYKINGKNYTLKLEKDELIINITGEKDKTAYILFPQELKGGFIENNELGFLDYCITKNSDEIRISRNQVSLEYAAYDYGDDGFDTDDYDYIDSLIGVLSVDRGKRFRIYLGVNCVFNLQSVNFDLAYDENKLNYIEALKPIDHNPISGNPSILSGWIGESYFYGSSCGADCKKISIVKVGRGPLGSGIAAEFEFEASHAGTANIGIKDLELIDASITPDTEGYIPPSAVGTSVRIN